ncbi:MAG: RsmB/NOP family class I SAM-dependent RNA methyltransferase [Nanoarchaeota archaeon]
MELKFKEKFTEKYSKLTNFEEYRKAVSTLSEKSIRVNTIKISVNELKNRLENKNIELEEVPWCKEGFYVKSKGIRLGNLEEHKLGYIFIQKSVSMIPALALDQNESDIVLDMCSAPGAKTTQIASLMNNKGIIIANESDRKRINILSKNLYRCGILNTIITNHSGDKIKTNFLFDKILLDAPCSGTGLIKGNIKRTHHTLKVWNENMVRRLAKLQKKLILNAFSLLKENGVLVYSTCSLEPDEDEDVINFLLERQLNAKLEKINLNIKSEYKGYIKIWPQYYNTEGFFVAKIRKI